MLLIYRIWDSNGNLASNLTTDKNIKKLIYKFTSPRKQSVKKLKEPTFIKNLVYMPPRPPTIIGIVQKQGKFAINFNSRFIEIDPIVGSMRRFRKESDFPNNPMYFYFI
jgi:hypothetical protein